MKKLLLLLMIVPMIGFGQTRKSAVISATSMNVLYQQVENPISVAVPEVKLSEISVEINNGTITKQSDGNYTVIPVKSGKATITVYVNTKKGKVKYGSMDFRVLEVPTPIVTASNIRLEDGYTVSRDDLVNAQKLVVVIRDFYFKGFEYEVVSYDLIWIDKAARYEINVPGTKFTAEVINAIRNTASGADVIFSNIKVRMKNGKGISNMGTLVYTIK